MFTLDPEIAAALAAFGMASTGMEVLAPGDIEGLRRITDASMAPVFATLPDAPGVTATPHETTAPDGGSVPMIWYAPEGGGPGSAILYVHGGGMVAGSAALYDRLLRHYVAITGVPFLSVDYRLAPEHSAVGLGRDALTGLHWLVGEAAALGVDPARIAIMGDSGGGGVAAAGAILARDAGVALAKQILIYPMIDDRNTVPDPLLASTALWSYDANTTAWDAILGEARGSNHASPYLAPSRLADFAGLAPAYIEVGELDIFRDESLVYAQKLLAAGVSCEFHLHPGAPHGHDWANMAANISGRVIADRVRVIRAV